MTDLTREQIEALWAGAAPHKYGNYLHIANLARQLLATMTERDEARAAQAGVVERAVDACVSALFVQFTNQARHLASRKPVIVASLADPTGVALLAELRDRAEKAEAGEDKWMNRCMEEVGQHLETKAERDRLAAANAALEAKVAGLVEAAEDAEYDLLQWLECSKSLTAAGFNMDGTADVTAKLTAALSHIKRGKTNG